MKSQTPWAIAPLVLAAALVAGCVSPAKPESMTARPVASGHPSNGDVSLTVSGGNSGEITDDAFAQALRDSLQGSGLFRAVVQAGARYQLKAVIGRIDHATAGVSFPASMQVSYQLIDSGANKTLWAESVTSYYTAKFSEAFMASARVRKAVEGAARDNIEQALTRISTLNLP